MASTSHTLTEEQYQKVKHLIEQEDKKYLALEDFVGGIVFFRTVTTYYVGSVEKISGNFMVLSDASWIPDTGRYYDFIKGTPDSNLEVEPIGNTMVNIDTIIDIQSYGKLLTEQE